MLVLLFSIGCTTTPVNVTFDQVQNKPAHSSDKNDRDCPIVINGITDARKDKKSLGTIGKYPINSEELISWISDTLKIKSSFLNNIPSSKKYLFADVSIKLAHIRTTDGIMKTNIVLALHNKNNNKTTHFRGVDTSVLWLAADSEIKNSFVRALSNIIDRMYLNLDKNCNYKESK